MTSDRSRGILALVLVTALWGVSFPLVGDVVEGRSTGQVLYFLFLRFGFATLAFLPLGRAVVRQSKGGGFLPWGLSFGIGALFFVAFFLQSLGLQHTTPSRSAFVTVLSVPMVPLLAAVVYRRAPSRVHLIGSLVATGGIALVLAPGGELEPNRGDWLTLASAFVFAVEILFLEYVARRAPVLIVSVGQIAAVAVFAAIGLVCVPFELPESWPGLTQAVLVTGFVCTTLALGGMTWGQARVGAEVAAVIFALEPIFASIFVWILHDQGLGPWQSVGGLVVFAAVAYSARVPVRSNTRVPELSNS